MSLIVTQWCGNLFLVFNGSWYIEHFNQHPDIRRRAILVPTGQVLTMEEIYATL